MKRFVLSIALMIGAFLSPALSQTAPFVPDFQWCATRGAIVTRTATGWQCLTPGTAGMVLQTNGGGADVTWNSVGGTGTVTSVALSGGTTGLTITGSPITSSGTMTLGGTLAIANGGTGAGSASAARTALGAVNIAGDTMTGALAVNTGSGTVITANASGLTAPAPLASVFHAVGVAGTASRVSIDAFAATPALVGRAAEGTAALPTATAINRALFSIQGLGYGTTGYTSSSRGGVSLLADQAFTDAAQGTRLEFHTTPTGSTTNTLRWSIGSNGTLSSATNSDIGGSSSRVGQIYAGAIDTSGAATIGGAMSAASGSFTTALPAASGGTGLSSYTAGDILVATGATTLTKLALGANGNVLTSNGTGVIWQAPAAPGVTSAPQVTVYTTGSGTYTTPAGALYLKVEIGGGGGGGGGAEGTTGRVAGGAGGNTTFGLLTANGGAGGLITSGTPSAATATNGDINLDGQMNGAPSVANNSSFGAWKRTRNLGPMIAGYGGANGFQMFDNGGGSQGFVGGPGGSGAYAEKIISSPAASYSYSVGAAGTAGTNGTGGTSTIAPDAGRAGMIRITAYFQ